MSEVVEQEIRTLRAQFWSARDPEGRAFAPLADAYRRKGELEEAVSLVEDGLARLPEFTPGHLVASRIHRARGDLVGARSSLDRVLDLDPENVLALLERAEVARAGGDRESASTDLRRLLELDPGHMGAKAALGKLESALEEAEGVAHEPHGEGHVEHDPERETSPVEETGSSELESAGAAAAEMDPFDFGFTVAGGPRPAPEEPSLGETDEPEEESAPPLEEDSGLDLDDPLDLGDVPELDAPFDLGDGPELDEAFDGPDMEEESEAPAGADLEAAARLDEALAPGEAFDPDDPPEVDRPELLTRTMAELFAKQGLHDRAVEVYARLLEREPESVALAARLDELRATSRAAGGDASPAGSASETTPPPVGRAEDERPFAEAVSSGGDSEAERTIREHFADLLAWTPGALPIERLHPDAPPERAPAGSRAWAWAQGSVPIEDLAPGAPLRTAPQRSPAAARASADAERASASLASGEPADSPKGDRATAATEESGDGTAAPVRSGSGEKGRDDDLDDFRAWLESLGP